MPQEQKLTRWGGGGRVQCGKGLCLVPSLTSHLPDTVPLVSPHSGSSSLGKGIGNMMLFITVALILAIKIKLLLIKKQFSFLILALKKVEMQFR